MYPISTAPPRRHHRPSDFHLPDGRLVIVAAHPSELTALQQKHHHNNSAPAERIVVVVRGSAAHCDFLRTAQRHHQAARQALRDSGEEESTGGRRALLDEWDRAGRLLDVVTAQMAAVEEEEDREHGGGGGGEAMALRANFSRFGFDAQLRVHGGGSTSLFDGSEEKNSEGNNSSVQDVDWNDRTSEAVSLWKPPVVKQYFHRGLLWRSSRDSEVKPCELFFDLLFVGIIAINGDHVAEEPNGTELLRFVVTFCMSWRIWGDLTQQIEWFEMDDILSQVGGLFVFTCLLGLTTNIVSTFAESHDTYTQLAGYYISARLFMCLWAAVTAFHIPMIRAMMCTQIAHYLLGAVFWIASTQLAYPSKLGFVFTALVIDLCGSDLYVGLFWYSSKNETLWGRWMGRTFAFLPAINIEHKVERVNAFVCLVLGYGVVGVFYQNQAYGLNAILGKAILGLVQGFVFNWLYFSIDSGQLHVHAIRRHAATAFLWNYIHLFFIMSYIIASAALSKLVVADDCPNASATTLTATYAAKSGSDIALGLRLFYCVGLGLALATMLVINVCHTHKVPAYTCRIPARWRYANRIAVCIVLFCLPAAGGQRLDSLQLVSVGTALSVWVLLVELVGTSCQKARLFGQETRCRYMAKCSRRELDEAIKVEATVEVREV